QMVLAEREWHGNNAARAEQILDEIPTKYRGWEWNYLKRVCYSEFTKISGPTTPVFAVAFSPNGQKIASASQDDGVMVWDAKTPKVSRKGEELERAISVAFSPDGKQLAAGVFKLEQRAGIWIGSADTGLKERIIPAHDGIIWCVAFNHDGTRLASAG